MHQALHIAAAAVARAHDARLLGLGRCRTLAGRIPHLEGELVRLEAENALLRARFLRCPVSVAPATAGTLTVRFLDGDPRPPIRRLRDAA